MNKMSCEIVLRCAVYFILSTLLFSCREENKSSSTDTIQQIVIFKKEGTLSIKKADSIITEFDIEIADDEYQRETGLMYRNSMAKHEGMLFIFEDEDFRNFYMRNTRFPLDIIYISSNKRIVSFQKNAQPRNEASLPSNTPAKYVLEINAGLSDQLGLEVGDEIVFEIL